MKKAKKAVKAAEVKSNYKGYDIEFLRENPNHPDFYLVAEYDKKKK